MLLDWLIALGIVSMIAMISLCAGLLVGQWDMGPRR